MYIVYQIVPIFGVFVDRYGKRPQVLMVCSILICTAHLVLGLTSWTPIPMLILLGLSYSLYGVAIWPSVATVVHHEEIKTKCKLLGTAFGISTASLNTALTIMPMISAQILVDGKSFLWVEVFFSCLAMTACLFSLLLWRVDECTGRVLQMPEMNAAIPSQDEESQVLSRDDVEDGDDCGNGVLRQSSFLFGDSRNEQERTRRASHSLFPYNRSNNSSLHQIAVDHSRHTIDSDKSTDSVD
jgi:MFS family permease